jgi:DNA-binding transcriptional MerR regulator
MFRIGDFSKIARVSGRLLRYYDSIGLLRPRWTDPETGYRYYVAAQLGRLNRILALKELGLTLEQVRRLLDDNVSSEEIRGMFLLRKAEIERTLAGEAARLRTIESRLRQIDESGLTDGYDIVTKPVARTPYLSRRFAFAAFADAVGAVRELAIAGSRVLPERQRGPLTVVAHSDFDDQNLDLELGFAVGGDEPPALKLADDLQFEFGELPAVACMATVARSGPGHEIHLGFGAIGHWMEANRFEIAGSGREVFLELPFVQSEPGHMVVEIQFPVRPATGP